MKAIGSPRVLALAFLALSLTVLPALALTPAHIWSREAGEAADIDNGYCIAMDDYRSVYVGGSFHGTVDFGTGPIASAGGTDIFIAKYDSLGTPQWVRTFGGPGDDAAYAMSAGNYLWVTGEVFGPVTFAIFAVGSPGVVAPYAVRMQMTDGVVAGSATVAANTTGSVAYGISGLLSGDYAITGYFAGNMFVGQNYVNNGGLDIFIGQFAPPPGATARWFHTYGSTQDDFGRAVSTDYSGDVFGTGSFRNTFNFGAGPLVSAGATDAYVVKFNSTGVLQWSKRYGDINLDSGYGIAADVYTGDTYTAGTLGNNMFLVKLAPDGSALWSKTYTAIGQSSHATVYAAAVDDSSGVVITGEMGGLVDLGGGYIFSQAAALFVAKYTAAGTPRWSKAYGVPLGAPGNAHGLAIASNFNDGGAAVTGYFIGPTSFGGNVLVDQGSQDIVIARYAGVPAEPVMTSVKDIGNDQGRQVKVRFNRSGYDIYPSLIDHYEIYRKDAAAPATALAAAPRRDPAITGWTEVGRVDAHADKSYGADVPTIGDSTITLGQYRSTFQVRAATDNRLVYYDSPPDSGFSIDNLAPAIPSNLVYGAGSLTWDKSPDTDFKYFTVYGASTTSFASATVVNYSIATSLDVHASPYAYYFVTATDFSGNEGKPAMVHSASGVTEHPMSYVLSVTNYPNPFNPRTTVRYTVPSHGTVNVTVYDARGSLVKTLFDGQRAAGAYSGEWDGHGANSAVVGSGVYFARIEHNGTTRTKKMVLLK